jgi:DNA mismatch repair protein MSH3
MERYHTPEVKKKIQELAQFQEALDAEAHRVFILFLEEIVQNYYELLRNAVNNLAIADCLLSLASVALQDGYVRPEFTDDDTLNIMEGRHPMTEALRTSPYVPNTIHMGGSEPLSKCITGPNMGGKSSCVRMIALITVMAQIGSYVPATSVRMGMLDGVLTRMGGK